MRELANDQRDETGIDLRVEVLPGKHVVGTFVDGRQAQLKARGQVNAPPSLSSEGYKEAVIHQLNWIVSGGLFGTKICDLERAENFLRPYVLYPVDSLNGHETLSSLFESLKK